MSFSAGSHVIRFVELHVGNLHLFRYPIRRHLVRVELPDFLGFHVHLGEVIGRAEEYRLGGQLLVIAHV